MEDDVEYDEDDRGEENEEEMKGNNTKEESEDVEDEAEDEEEEEEDFSALLKEEAVEENVEADAGTGNLGKRKIELIESDEPTKKKKKKKAKVEKCLVSINLYMQNYDILCSPLKSRCTRQVCGEKGHRKMDCEKLPEERRKELKVASLSFNSHLCFGLNRRYPKPLPKSPQEKLCYLLFLIIRCLNFLY